MLKAYKPISNNIYKAQDLIEFLVNEVWCKADGHRCKTKLNDELTKIYEKYDWFEMHVRNIYKVCKRLTSQERADFKNAFSTNNDIEGLCNGSLSPVPLSSLNNDLVNAITPFFEKLYTKFLGWALVYKKYGTKKKYYDKLMFNNNIDYCPCCGYGDLKDYYSKGYSPYDHYLSKKHYPFSAINFNNLVPLCHTCNSDYKGETDIIKDGQIVFYPFASNHPNIEVKLSIDTSILSKLISKVEVEGKEKVLKPEEIKVDFNINNNKIEAWDSIFDIKNRYFGKIARNRVSWLNDVIRVFRDPEISTSTPEKAFDKVIELDSDKHLGFLKSPYLKSMKSNNHLIEAMSEVSGNSIIS